MRSSALIFGFALVVVSCGRNPTAETFGEEFERHRQRMVSLNDCRPIRAFGDFLGTVSRPPRGTEDGLPSCRERDFDLDGARAKAQEAWDRALEDCAALGGELMPLGEPRLLKLPWGDPSTGHTSCEAQLDFEKVECCERVAP